ncbi:MAG: hypothetical protein JNL73_16575 [Anaerolineales bacterium]|nr:hypothetical protein [Anaerolineales bacterium]
MTTRHLSDFEIQEARRVFGDGLDYTQVRVVERNYFPNFVADIGAALQGKKRTWDNGITLGNHVMFPRVLRTEPAVVDGGDLMDIGWLMHELTHTWQFQRVGWRYLVETLGVQIKLGMSCYNYQGNHATKAKAVREACTRGQDIEHFNFEQQGDFSRDYYFELRAGREHDAWEPLVNSFRSKRHPLVKRKRSSDAAA